MNNAETRSKYHLELYKDGSPKKLLSFNGSGKRLLLSFLIGLVAAFMLFFLIVCITPLKRLVPGYPTEKARKEILENRIMLDSLKTEIGKWQRQLQDIQTITSGRVPKQALADSTTQQGLDAQGAEWKEKEEMIRKQIEDKQKQNAEDGAE